MRSAESPLAFDEIFARLTSRMAVRTRKPRATVRGALSQGRQLVSTGDGRFGYLPRLLQGSVVRWPLDSRAPADGPLPFPDDVRHALFPDFFEIGKCKLRRPARLHLPNGGVAMIELEHLGESRGGVRVPPTSLQRLLRHESAGAGDSLIVRVLDGEAGDFDVALSFTDVADGIESAIDRARGAARRGIELTPLRVMHTPEVTHMRYRVDGRSALDVDYRVAESASSKS